MAEIKKELIKLREGQSFIAEADDFVITGDHSLSDILRFCVWQTDLEDVKYMIDHLEPYDEKV